MASQLTYYHYLLHDMPNLKFGDPNFFTIPAYFQKLLLRYSKGEFFTICDQYFYKQLELASTQGEYERLYDKTHELAQLLLNKYKQ